MTEAYFDKIATIDAASRDPDASARVACLVGDAGRWRACVAVVRGASPLTPALVDVEHMTAPLDTPDDALLALASAIAVASNAAANKAEAIAAEAAARKAAVDAVASK